MKVKNDSDEKPKLVELSTKEAIRIAKEIIETGGHTFDVDVAFDMIDGWYKNSKTKITNASRVDIAHFIVVMTFGAMDINSETVKANVAGMAKSNPYSLLRTTKCLVEYNNLLQSLQ